MSEPYASVQAFWKQIRQGRKAYPKTPAPRRVNQLHRLRSAHTPSALAAHRAALEHDYFGQNPKRLQLLREAAVEYDALLAYEKTQQRKKSA